MITIKNNDNEAFREIVKCSWSNNKYASNLYLTEIDTPVGEMMIAADKDSIWMLHYLYLTPEHGTKIVRPGLVSEVIRLTNTTKTNPCIEQTASPIVKQLVKELELYFDGKLKEHFQTPVRLFGTEFSRQVWKSLLLVPYGLTSTYKAVAESVGRKSTSSRSVGSAIGSNQLVIYYPCHRIITGTGKHGGYNGGVERKRWLLEHEQNNYDSMDYLNLED